MSSAETRLRSSLLAKQWVGFDLDDTLHEFRVASSQASQTVFDAIALEHSEIQRGDLKTTYQDILRSATADAFTDGRTSADYRRDRFSQLLQAHGVKPDSDASRYNDNLKYLLEVYQSTLKSSLKAKPGAISVIKALRSLGKKIIIVTEGPADAQEWTVKELGLQPFIDVLITTNEIGKSKVDGLFGVVLQKYGIDADNIVYFGDNPARDIEAARKEGIMAILYNETRESQFEEIETLSIQSWKSVQSLLIQSG